MENQIEQKNNTQERYILHCAAKLKEVMYEILDGPFSILLSLGERNHIKKFMSLTQMQWEIFSLLQRRVPQNTEKFLSEFNEAQDEVEKLLQTGLCILYKNHRLCIHHLSKSELRIKCTNHGLSKKGNVAVLRSRLIEILPQIEVPTIIHIANPKLIERCIAWMTNSHDGSWDKDVHVFLHERQQAYQKTKLLPLYKRRFDFWSYYYGRFYFNTDRTWARLFITLPPQDYQFRFSLHRQFFINREWIQTSLGEKIVDALQTDIPYQSTQISLLSLELFLQKKYINKRKIKSYIRSLQNIDFKIFEMDLRRKIKHIEKKYNENFFPRYPLENPKKRHLYLPKFQKKRQRITFEVDGENLNVELATIAWLKKINRPAMYTENHGWRALLHWLFLDIHFEPIEGMLPFLNMNHPLDYYLGSSYFERRRFLFENRLSLFHEVSKNDDIFFAKIEDHFQEMFQKYPTHLTHRKEALFILQSFSFPQLIPLLRYLLQHPNQLRGLPDLLVQRQNRDTCSNPPLNIFPPRIPTNTSFFVEIKCRDSVSTPQFFWHHKLIELGFVVEIWNLHEMN